MAQAKATVNKGTLLRKAADKYGVTKSTMERACHGKQCKQFSSS